MINRNLIRIRTVQIVYSWYQNTNNDLQKAEKELMFGLQKSYDLYYYMLQLMLEITKAYENRVEAKKNKFLPTKEDLNPNLNLLDNKFILQLSDNIQLQKYLTERPLSWENNETYIKNILDTILDSDVYKNYSLIQSPSYDQDREFWRKIFKQYMYGSDELADLLEDESIYWNDDIDIVQSFVDRKSVV